MSQSTMPQPVEPSFSSPASVQPYHSPGNEFNYRPLPVLAPVSLFLGVCSVLGLFGLFGIAIALIGTLLGAICLTQILRSAGELGGKLPAAAGFSLSCLFLVWGSGLYAYSFATEVPEGYARVNFTRDISKKEFVVEEGRQQIHPEVQALDGEKIFVKGYMYPELQTTGLTSFVLVKDSGECCFGGQPEMTDMILVEMQEGKQADYRTGLVAVAGVFRAQEPSHSGELTTVYKLEGTHFDRAQTAF